MFKYFLSWLPMLLIAIVNGALRDLWYRKFIDEPAAHQLSVVSLMLFLGMYTWVIINEFPPVNESQAIWIGLMWMILTLGFEFGFGRFRGHSWSSMLEDYNLMKGRIWIFIPLWVFVLPYICWLASDK